MKKKSPNHLVCPETNCAAELKSTYLKLVGGLLTPEQALAAAQIIWSIREIQINGH